MNVKPSWYKELQKRRWQTKVLINRSGGFCEKCGDVLNLLHGDQKQATRDHIIPSCEGGSEEMSNLQVLCRECNEAKGGDLLVHDDEMERADATGQ